MAGDRVTLEELLRCRADEVTFDQIKRFCAMQIRENVLVEYKREFSSRDERTQIAKQIAAFSNTQGGVILWGVAETEAGSGRPAREPSGERLGGDPQAKIRDACSRAIFPAPNVEISAVLQNPDDEGRGFVFVRVHRGEYVPYTVGNVIYERVMDSSEPRAASLDTVSHLLRSRDRARDVAAQRAESGLKRVQMACGARADNQPYPVILRASPAFRVDALLQRNQLLDAVSAAAAKTHLYPLGVLNRNAMPVADGILCRLRAADGHIEVLYVDICGNAILCDRSARGIRGLREELDGCTPRVVRQVGVPVYEYDVSDAKRIAARLVPLFEFSRELQRSSGHVGATELELIATGVCGTPLLHFLDGDRPHFLGAATVDFDLSVREICGIDEQSIDAAERAFCSLQWAWGAPNAWTLESVLRYPD